jgi:tetratricopeptide (TPR) repeat protein
MTSSHEPPNPSADLQALGALAQREYRAGRLAEAAAAYRQILAIRPDSAEARNDLGILLALDGQAALAAIEFERAIALRPDLPDPYLNLGKVQNAQGKIDEAAARFEQALALRPSDAQAHNHLGSVRWKLDQLQRAAESFRRAIALRPDFAEAHFNLGGVFWKQNDFQRATECFEQALALRPDYAEAHNSIGILLAQQGRLDEAIKRFEQALALAPLYAEAQCCLATCYLLSEDYRRGWPAYEARLRLPGAATQPNCPRWQGEPLAGRKLLLWAEQGLGDTLFFVRYARVFRAAGARVVLAVQPALGRLLTFHPDVDELFIWTGGELPRCDFHLPLQSAPLALGTDGSTIPGHVPYLWADRSLSEAWRRELAAIEGFKIGIAWQGSRGYHLDRWRSMPLACFAPLARLPGVRLVSLQKGFGTEQIGSVDFPVVDFSRRLDESAGPLMDTAAVIGNLDLVVAPDSALAHLAGGLGAPVWVALQSVPDWRWLRDRDDSPWYPTARIFRQTSLGQWSDVFERMAQALQTRRGANG